ncbi:Scr1 family TA system antitoxin-like transcriptional regulator [Streptomyces sp. NPDC005355]|uniref:helix-turn-helix domain-containing protein n=1 Tax=Streptomyces sp. NPDC005355 TaxID=3157038 RepID=UPI0033A3148A
MNDVTNNKEQSAPAPRHGSLYRWDIHQVSNSRHQQGPCGTCTTEDSARACIEAALSAAVGPGVYAWGLLSRMPAGLREPTPSSPRTPLAWAAPGPDGTVAWLPHAGRPLITEETSETPVVSSGQSISSLLSRFGGEVQRYRLIAGLTQGELAERAHCATTTVQRLENAEQMPSRVFAQRVDRLLGVDGALVKLWPSLIRSAYPDWFWQVIELEQQASFIQEFETVAVPGLLQTEAYARTIFTAAHPVASKLRIEQLVGARIDRQRILTRREPPQIMITLDEGVLRRRIGGNSVMSEQLGHLLQTADLPKVHLQVLPFNVREHPGGMTPFRLMGFRDGPDVLYGETFIGGQTTNDASQIQQHKLAFNLIQSKALSRDDSCVFMRDVKKEIDRESD